MSGKNRQLYLTSSTLDQPFLDWCADNLDNKLEMVVDIETPTGTIHASDRNKYVGGTFYEALLVFPVIKRTVGEWLAPTIQFSQLQLELSNVDGRYNDILPHGANYGSWVGKTVQVRMGLAESASTYTTIFSGTITEVGGVVRSVKSVTIIARDNYEKLSTVFPNTSLTTTVYPDLDDGLVGKILPYIYGDYTVSFDPSKAVVPAYPTNGKNAGVLAFTSNLALRISENDLKTFDTTNVYLFRNDKFYLIDPSDVVNVGSGNKTFEIKQGGSGGITSIDGGAFEYSNSDTFFVRVKGKDLGAYSDNIVWIARDILMTFGGALSGDFHSNWATYRDKSSPAQSNIAGFKCRVWEDEPKSAIEYALSLLEQVRLEAFIDRSLKLKINSLHFEDYDASPSFSVKNWDTVKDTFQPQLETQNNFNRAQGAYDFHPNVNANARSTPIYNNAASVTQIQRAISKLVSFPNLYVDTDVEYQLIEVLRLASAMLETVTVTLTWRALLKDIGEFVKLNVEIGGTIFQDVPAMIRDIGYDPKGLTIPMKLWSMALCPFPGYTPGYGGTVGGYNATITQET
jgi:hypothetical protein